MNGSGEQHAATFQQYHALLFSIAYRMLGSVAEAEDVLQDAYLRFQTAKLSEVASPKAYLSTIVTRLCLNVLESARARRESYVGTWLPEPVLTTADAGVLSDEESISLAFLKLLENLTPLERAVFLLHEVFDYDYADVAQMLDRSEAACRKLFSRAKQYLSENRPRFAASPVDASVCGTRQTENRSSSESQTVRLTPSTATDPFSMVAPRRARGRRIVIRTSSPRRATASTAPTPSTWPWTR